VKNRKTLLIPLCLILMIVALITYGVVSTNTNSNARDSSADNYKATDESSDSSTPVGSKASISDVLNDNNEELFKMIDTRKTVIFAIYGTDERSTEETGRSDIIMVVMYDPATKKMVIASLPRDLRVNIPGYGLDKINHAYAYGGKELIDQTIEELLGIKLNFSIKADFETFGNIIDTVGGVSVNAKKQFYSSYGLVINEGQQVLNGKQALYYVRFRSDSDGDYGRIARQQEVVISLINSLKARSYSQLIKLIDTYYNKGMETDANLAKIKDYINMSSQDNVITYENYRLQTYSEIIDGLWYELYNQEDLDAIKSLFVNNEEANLENWK